MQIKTKLTKFQEVMLINAHPVKFIFNTIGGVIALYFLWQKDPVSTVIFGGIFIAAGTIISRFLTKFNAEAIAKTFLGKIFLIYSEKSSFILYMASHILIPLAFWMQNLYIAAFGLLLLGLGAILNWKKYIT